MPFCDTDPLIIDCFLPESAPAVLEAVSEYDDETIIAALWCWSFAAQCEVNNQLS